MTPEEVQQILGGTIKKIDWYPVWKLVPTKTIKKTKEVVNIENVNKEIKKIRKNLNWLNQI
jgi:hypothetical protein